MGKNKKKIINKATEFAKSRSQSHKDFELRSLENFRNELDVETYRIEKVLDKPENWYINRIGNGNSSHEFYIKNFEEVNIFLLIVENRESEDESIPLETINDESDHRRDQLLHRLEILRDSADISEERIDKSLNKYSGWYSDSIDDRNMALRSYYECLLLLEYIVIGMDEIGGMNSEIENLRNEGYIAESV